ncbi:MAG: OmpA family protein [Bacteroidetes bacterium]|nr:OmpA family protein [Bacteroidota bacterium]
MRWISIALLSMITLAGYTQKPSVIGFSFNLVDFSASVPKIGKTDPGFSLMYWKGIGRKTDFSVRYNGLFSDYLLPSGRTSGYINEFEASLHGRPIDDDHVLSPFLSAGIGIGQYNSNWVPYAPLGGGLQLNMLGEGYIFLQANYRASFKTPKLDNNMFYSLGFTQTIGRQHIKESIKPPPSVPVAEVKDRDGDGVPDSLDVCPDAAGNASLHGCPDSDNDGIADKDDKCPQEKGIARYNGCPIPDTDGDGINDEEDKCPQTRGVARYQGCPVPDRDGDGVNDEEDKCPDLPGPPSNSGCPIVKEEVKQKADYAGQHLYFAIGSARILKPSFKGLDQVIALMKEDHALRLLVDGYTDNTGNADRNQVLSENRAGAVKKYLVAKGIEADRINASGHGARDPIADNKISSGRAKNRRVEFKLQY